MAPCPSRLVGRPAEQELADLRPRRDVHVFGVGHVARGPPAEHFNHRGLVRLGVVAVWRGALVLEERRACSMSEEQRLAGARRDVEVSHRARAGSTMSVVDSDAVGRERGRPPRRRPMIAVPRLAIEASRPGARSLRRPAPRAARVGVGGADRLLAKLLATPAAPRARLARTRAPTLIFGLRKSCFIVHRLDHQPVQVLSRRCERSHHRRPRDAPCRVDAEEPFAPVAVEKLKASQPSPIRRLSRTGRDEASAASPPPRITGDLQVATTPSCST